MKRVLKTGNGEIVEKKSRFIGICLNVESEEEAMSRVNEIKKKYYDARHSCYGYIIGDKGDISRFSDDGEPSGTAGKPILDVIAGNELTNCLVVVTRYFGGTLLGTGGLVKAYQQSAKEAILAATLTEVTSGVMAELTVDYNSIGKLQYICSTNDVLINDTVYEENVRFVLVAADNDFERFKALIKEAFCDKFTTENVKKVEFYRKDNIAVVM